MLHFYINIINKMQKKKNDTLQHIDTQTHNKSRHFSLHKINTEFAAKKKHEKLSILDTPP